MERRKIKRDTMIKKGTKVKGFRFHGLNSAHVPWSESMAQYIGLEGTVHKIAEGPHGIGSRFEVRFPRHWDKDYSNEANASWSNTIGVMYPLAEYLQHIREERLNEIGI
jgi:hypothetical protein